MNVTRILPRSSFRLAGNALLAGALLFSTAAVFTPQAEAQVYLSVGIAPPAIPVYEQPLCPGDGYIWTPGYWAWSDDGYEWIDGAWVVAPYTGALWTPGYWGYGGNGYLWNAGYWGREVGYYGGINYGFGYFGTGFYGGYWGGNRFFYNQAYNRIDLRREHNVYERREQGFNGRPGGVSFDRNQNHGGFDHQRGSFAGLHDDHRQSQNTVVSGYNGGNRHDSFNNNQNVQQHGFNTNNDQRGFAGNGNQGRNPVQSAPAPSQAPFSPNTNFRRSPNTVSIPNNGLQGDQNRQNFNNPQQPARQPFQGDQNRQSFNNPQQPARQPFQGNQNPGNQSPYSNPSRPVYNGGGQSFPGGNFNRSAPPAPQPQQPQQQRQSFTPAPQNNAPRSFSPAPQAPTQAPRQFSGGSPQGGNNFHGGGGNNFGNRR